MRHDFAKIFDLTTAAYAIINDSYEIQLVNDAYCRAVGRDRDAIIGANVFDLFPETTVRQRQIRTAFDAALNGQSTAIEEIHYPIIDMSSPDDAPTDMWWTVNCTPLDDETPCFLCQIENVTATVQSRKTRDIFAAELQHRIGNVLNVVQILARKTAKSSRTLDDYLPAFDARITALGKTHAYLSGQNWNGMTLRNILEQHLSGNLISRPDAISLNGPDWHLSVLHAQAFSLAIHELMINSVSHGALGADGGKISVSWDNPSDGSYHFSWLETGLKNLTEPAETGFGLQMLTTLLPGQLGGKAVSMFRPDGFSYTLTVPQNAAVPVGQRRPSNANQG